MTLYNKGSYIQAQYEKLPFHKKIIIYILEKMINYQYPKFFISPRTVWKWRNKYYGQLLK